MGQKKIKIIDLASQEPSSALDASHRPIRPRSARDASPFVKTPGDKSEGKGAKKGRKVIKGGKGEHGRLADMGVSAEETQKLQETEKIIKKAKKGQKKPSSARDASSFAKASGDKSEGKRKKPKKTRSKRYQALSKKIDKTQEYPLEKALKLLLEISNGNFDESVEMHLLMNKKSKETEKKFPLVHKKIGKISEGEKKLLKNLRVCFESLKSQQIRKAVLTSTMSPGIKLNLEELQN